jgi:non-ribosomal peptide synthetase component E (peptide arylation enzyme)
MIVGPGHGNQAAQRTTLDDLFRRAAVRNPDAVALIDPDDRAWFADGEPRRLTYAQADRVVWTLAARLRALGLQTDAVVGIQLPNTVETVLALLATLRAGLIAAPLPMLWRESEIVAALSSVGAKAIVTTSRIGATDHGALARRVAAGLFSIRHLCAFGETPCDGALPLDDVFAAEPEMVPAAQRDGNPATHAAVVTFEPTPRGLLPVVRNHFQLIAGGMAVIREFALSEDLTLLSATAPSSFAGLSVTLLPWLLSGGRLVLHQPFDADLFRAQQRAHGCNAIVIPGSLAAAFSDFDDSPMTIALWRSPERINHAPWTVGSRLLDVTAFGEFGLHAALRQPNVGAAPLPLGPIRAPRGLQDGMDVIETRRNPNGTLALRGAMAAGTGFATSDNSEPNASDGFVDTSYLCRIDPQHGSLIVTGPQPGMIGIGGYRIAGSDVDAIAAALPPDSAITALPDGLLGQRLHGRAPDPADAVAALAARGANPLLSGAFQRRAAANL